MKTVDEFVTLLHEELGLVVTAADLDRSLADIAGWDSLHLLWMITTLEQRTGRQLSLPDLLEAPTLRGIYRVAVPA